MPVERLPLEPEPVPTPEQAEAQQQRQGGAIAEFAGAVATAGSDLLRTIALMRPNGTLTDAQLPAVTLDDDNGACVETRRPDNTRQRTYNTGARLELDASGRVTEMHLPGPLAPRVQLQYNGNDQNPSAVSIDYGGKRGVVNYSADQYRLEVNHRFGRLEMTHREVGGGGILRITGEHRESTPGGGTRATNYNHADRSNTTIENDAQGNQTWLNVDRSDGSGYSTVGGELAMMRFAPGEHHTYTDGNGRDHVIRNVRTLSPTANNGFILHTAEGRMFEVTNPIVRADGRRFAGTVTERFKKR